MIDALLERGITPSDVRFGEGFEDDVALSSRRLVYEAVLRRKVEAEAHIELRSGVDLGGLIARSDKTVSTVTGLRTRDGEQLHADLVVDACGRRSAAPRWLREIGESAPVEVLRPYGLHYFALLAERVHSLLATDAPLGNGFGLLPRSEFEALVL